MKVEHTLHKSQSISDLQEKLAASDIDIKKLVYEYIKPGIDVGIIATGSIAEGTGSSMSDLDIMVFIESENAFLKNSNVMNLKWGGALEVLLYKNGIEINIDFMCKNKVTHIIDSFIQIAPALYDPKELDVVALINPEDLHFIHRMKTGWIIDGKQIVENWRDEFMVDVLSIYLTVRNYLDAIEALEDAISAIGTSPHKFMHTSRICVQFGLLALLNHHGFTSQRIKFMFDWSARITDEKSQIILRKGTDLFFFALIEGPENHVLFIDEIVSFLKDIRKILEANPEIFKAIAYLRDTINYVDLRTA